MMCLRSTLCFWLGVCSASLAVSVGGLPCAAADDSVLRAFDGFWDSATAPTKNSYTPREFMLGATKVTAVTDSQAVNVSNEVLMPGPGGGHCKIAVRFWFVLKNGRIVDPVRYRWKPNERFDIHVESCVPLELSIWQNYRDRRSSVMVYPLLGKIATYSTTLPGRKYELPVDFIMDNDLDNEEISFVLIRSDSGCLPINDTQVINQIVNAQGANVVNVNQIAQQTMEKMKLINNEAVNSGEAMGRKIRAVSVPPSQASFPPNSFATRRGRSYTAFLAPHRVTHVRMVLRK